MTVIVVHSDSNNKKLSYEEANAVCALVRGVKTLHKGQQGVGQAAVGQAW